MDGVSDYRQDLSQTVPYIGASNAHSMGARGDGVRVGAGSVIGAGAVLLPGLAMSFVLLAPFLDSGPDRALSRRKPAALAGFGLLAAVVLLTALALL